LHPVKPHSTASHTVDPQTNSSAVIRELDTFESDSVIFEHFFSHLYVSPIKINNFKAKSPTLLQISIKIKVNFLLHLL